MTKERVTSVDLVPELVGKVADNADALMCLSGIAYMAAIMLEEGKLPEFKRSLSIQLDDLFGRSNLLRLPDLCPGEEQLLIDTSLFWGEVTQPGWTSLGIMDVAGHRHTKVNIVRAESPNAYTLNIGPYGQQ